jgi:CHAT domain-containing protein
LRPLDERTLGIGESHDYYFPMKKGEYLRIDVEQNDDIDAGIRLFDSTGKLLFHANSYSDTHGAETLSWITQVTTVVRAQVYAWSDRSGNYSASVDGPRPPSAYDLVRTIACRTLFEGIRYEEISPRPLRWLAEVNYREAVRTWEHLSEPRWTAVAIRHLARLLYDTNRPSESVRYFRRAWPTLLAFEESLFILEAAVVIGRALEDERRYTATERYFVEAALHFPAVNSDYSVSYARDLAKLAARIGHLEFAAIFANQAVRTIRASGNARDLPEALAALSYAMRRLGRIDEARRAATALSKIAQTPEQEVQAAVALSMAAILSGYPESAISILQPALELQVTTLLQAELRSYLGRALIEARRPRESIPHLRSSAAMSSGGRRAIDLGLLALAELRCGDTTKAAVWLQSAGLEPGKRTPDEQAFLFRVAAEIARAEGKWEDSLRSLDSALRQLSDQRVSSRAHSLGVSYWSTKANYVEFATELLIEADAHAPENGLIEKAFLIGEASRAPFLTARLASNSNSRTRLNTPAVRLGLRRIDALISDFTRRLPIGWRSEVARLEQQRGELILEAILTESLLNTAAPGIQAPHTSIFGLRDQLEADDVFLSFQLGQNRSYAWLLTRETLKVWPLPQRSVIEEAATTAIEALEKSRGPGGVEKANNATQKLSDLILAPFQTSLTARRLILSLDGALHRIPFNALPAPTGSGMMIDQYEVSVVPSLTALALSRRRPSLCSGTTVLRAIDPSIRTSLDLQAVRRLDPEAREVIARRDSLFSGEFNTQCILHFATHGTSDEIWPDTAALEFGTAGFSSLATERIYAFEIEALEIASKLVVLAACESGVGDVGGEGLYGLPRAFLAAGSNAVVASLWPVDGEATGELMSAFYNYSRNGDRASTALRKAQLAVRKQSSRHSQASWASYQLIGDPSIRF